MADFQLFIDRPKSGCNCKHRDCKYHVSKYNLFLCDYMSVTGKSRLLYHRKNGLSENVEDCQLYESGTVSQRKAIVYSKKPQKKERNTAPPQKSPEKKYLGLTKEKLIKLVSARLVDKQIASLHGCSKTTVAHARLDYGIASAGTMGSSKLNISQEEAARVYEEVFGENKRTELENDTKSVD